MTLDDRMRAAQQSRLKQTQDRIDGRLDPVSVETRAPAFGQRLFAVAAALVVVGGGAVMISRFVVDDNVIEADVGESGPSATEPSASDSDTSHSGTTDSARNEGPPVDDQPDDAGAAAATAVADSDGGDGHDDLSALEASSTEVVMELDAGIETTVCPSGRRASLEAATLRYVGQNQGWDRLGNLVDEQDGPFYFKGWEPGYPESVTVEVELLVPALITDIRIAQDPITEVSGPITITVGDETVIIELAGLGGWKVHSFDHSIELERFTITRSSVEANVMEVMVCLAENR